MERKIPLVSARWVEESIKAKTLMDTADFPPANKKTYTMPEPGEYKYKYNPKVIIFIY